MITDKEKAVLEAAREWLSNTEGFLRGSADQALALVVLEAFPEDAQTKEKCECGSREECEECLSQAQAMQSIARLRAEVAQDRLVCDAYIKTIEAVAAAPLK